MSIFKHVLCEYCGDTATRIKKIKQPFWPFAVKSCKVYCEECYREIIYGKLPDVTGPQHQSKKGCGIRDRRQLFD